MGRRLAHRGPDGAGTFVSGPVGMFHCRLAVIDPAGGAQPMSTVATTVAFNGEIYNDRELRDELRARGRAFRTNSDTEVLLQLWEEYGEESLHRLSGMFAFVIHDRRRGVVVAARDHFGIKPLYLHARPDRLLFASEIKALLADPGVAAERDDDALAQYLTFQYVLGEDTLFRGITKVPPGHALIVSLADLSVRRVRYWRPSFEVDAYHTEEYFRDRLRELLEETVRLQLRSDVPLGTYLSGGLDSSVVTLLAARARGAGAAPLATFTGAFAEGPEYDETRYAREVAAAAHAVVHEVWPTEDEFVDLLPRLVWHMDEPAAGPGVFPQFVVARCAARHVKVVLGGQGGDEIFGGYARYLVAYLEQALRGAIFETHEEGEHIVSLRSILPNLPHLARYVPMLREFWAEGAFEPMDRRYFRLIDRSASSHGLLSADVAARHGRAGVFERFRAVFDDPETRSYFNKMTHYDMVASLPALLQVEDRVTMAHGLESRVPLLDRRLVDLVTPMPPRMKFRGAELKFIFKRAVGDLVPRAVLERKDKMGFPVPLARWNGRAREFVRDTLRSRRCRERGLFDAAGVERLLEDGQPFDRRAWGLLNLELWHRQFLDAEVSQAEASWSTR